MIKSGSKGGTVLVWKCDKVDAYVLLASLLREARGMDSLPHMERREGGKPFFPGHPNLHFNLSHSRDLGMAALADAPVGCDVEVVRPRSESLPRYALDDEQFRWFQSRGERWEDFCALWTLKEARVKCTGQGLRLHPRDIAVPLPEPGQETVFDGFRFLALAGDRWRAALCEKL